MGLRGVEREQLLVLGAAFLLLGGVFAASALQYLNPPVKVLEAKVFDVYVQGGKTFILTYGKGKLKLNGVYDLEVNATYRITYQSTKRDLATRVISIEKIG